MEWIPLINKEQLNEIKTKSAPENNGAVLVFKHSTRCSISSMALSRLERQWNVEAGKLPTYYLDLLNYRDLSGLLAQEFNVEHQSPQVLLIKSGVCVYNQSHNGISMTDLQSYL